MLQWLKPRAAAVKSLRLRGWQSSNPRSQTNQIVPVEEGRRQLHDFTG